MFNNKCLSRPDRYYNSISKVRSSMKDHDSIVEESMSAIRDSLDTLYNSVQGIKDVMLEYEDWESCVEGSKGSKNLATYKKLEDVLNAKDDIDSVNLDYGIEKVEELGYLKCTDLKDAMDTAENLELPIGFGRD